MLSDAELIELAGRAAADWQPKAAGLRTAYARKSKLMALLTEAGI